MYLRGLSLWWYWVSKETPCIYFIILSYKEIVNNFILICITYIRWFSNLDFYFFVTVNQNALKFIKFVIVYVQFDSVNIDVCFKHTLPLVLNKSKCFVKIFTCFYLWFFWRGFLEGSENECGYHLKSNINGICFLALLKNLHKVSKLHNTDFEA